MRLLSLALFAREPKCRHYTKLAGHISQVIVVGEKWKFEMVNFPKRALA